jgi:hypothetical protein
MILPKQMILNCEVTKNNRRYSIEVLESIRDQINSRSSDINIGTLGYPEGLNVNLRAAAFKYSGAEVRDGALYADIEVIETEMGDELKRLLLLERTGIRFRPAGQATLGGEVPVETLNLLNVPHVIKDDYELITIAAIRAEEDAVQFEPEFLTIDEVRALRPSFSLGGGMSMVDWFEVHRGEHWCHINSGLRHADGETRSPFHYEYNAVGAGAEEEALRHFTQWWLKIKELGDLT